MLWESQGTFSEGEQLTPVGASDVRVERRGEKRHIALLRVALFHSSGSSDLCVVKNVSSSGLAGRVYRSLSEGDDVTIEFRSGELLRGSVVWQRDHDFGMAFPKPVAIDSVLASRWVREGGRRRNLPRIAVSCRGRLERGDVSHSMLLRDISQGGAKVKTATPIKPGNVLLSLPELPPCAGVVRWASGTEAGISFNECIPFDQLARWIHAYRAGRFIDAIG